MLKIGTILLILSSILQTNNSHIEKVNLELLMVVLITSTIGSIGRIAEENSTTRMKFSKVVAVYSCALVIGCVFYLLAEEKMISNMVAGIGSLISALFAIEIFKTIRYDVPKLFSNVLKGMGSIILSVVANYLNTESKKEENNEYD